MVTAVAAAAIAAGAAAVTGAVAVVVATGAATEAFPQNPNGSAGGAAALGIPGLVAWTLLPPKPLHGAARLARPGEIAGAQLYRAGAHSILLGRHRGRLLAFNGDLHPFLAAATGTGKGVGFVVPNLLHWQGSAIVLDIKGENYTLTSGYRGRTLGQKVYRFDPL